MRETDIAWAAGLFDGEGTVGIYWGKRNALTSTWGLQAVVYLTDRKTLEEFHEIVGLGTLRAMSPPRTKPHWKQQWRWRAYGAKAGKVLQLLLPHLRLKAEQAEASLEFLSTLGKGYNRRNRTPQAVLDKRAELAGRVKELKLVG